MRMPKISGKDKDIYLILRVSCLSLSFSSTKTHFHPQNVDCVDSRRTSTSDCRHPPRCSSKEQYHYSKQGRRRRLSSITGITRCSDQTRPNTPRLHRAIPYTRRSSRRDSKMVEGREELAQCLEPSNTPSS